MNTIPVVLFSQRSKAEPLQQRLAQEGLNANINDGPKLTKLWFVSRHAAGVRVEVPACHFERATRLLLDWDAAEGALRQAIRCPECKSLRVDYPQYAKHSLLTNLAMGLLAELGVVEKDYYCEDCHLSWPKEGAKPRRDRPHLAPFYFIEGVEQTTLAQSTQKQSPAPEPARKAA